MDRAAYEELIASGPRPQAAAAYRRALLADDQVPGRDPWRILQFWILVTAFVGTQWVLIRRPEPWLWPICSVLLGLILVSMFALLHELMHYAVIKNRTITWVHGWIAGFYSGLTPDSWKDEHDTHHNNLGHPGEDPDAVYDLAAWQSRRGTRRAVGFLPGTRTVVSLLARPFWWMAVHALTLFTRYLRLERVPRWRKALAVSVWVFDVGAQLTLIATLGWRYGVFGFLLPVIIQNLLLTYFLLGTHLIAPRTDEMDPVLGSISVQMGPVLRLFFLDAGRHTEHHLFPGTSHRRLANVTKTLNTKFPERFNQVRFRQVVAALEGTGRVYVGNDLLWNPSGDRFSSPFRHAGEKLVAPTSVDAKH